jgi:hypothetical protein
VVNEKNITVNPTAISTLNSPPGSIDLVAANEAFDNLITEGGEDLYNYVNKIGLAKDPNMIVLSSRHGYFYGGEEISNAKIVINLKELNQIKEINSFLQSCLISLPERCNFIGCFVNNKKIDRFVLRNNSDLTRNKKNSDSIELGIVSRFPFMNRLYSLLDLKTNSYMSERSVTLLLKCYGLEVLDMTEYKGLTFFHSQKVSNIYN